MMILSWNYRGLGSKVKEESMKDLILLAHPDIILIQEPNMDKDAFLQVSAKLWKKGGSAAISSRGASEALEPYGMTINSRLLTSSTTLVGSSHC